MYQETGPIQRIDLQEGERREPLPKRIVGLVVEDECGRLLCQRRPFGIRHGGKWTVTAGGHQEIGESDDRTLERETMEEIGIDVPEGTTKSLEFFFPGRQKAPGIEEARPAWLQMYTKRIGTSLLPTLTVDPGCVAEMDWLYPEELLVDPTALQPEFLKFVELREQIKRAPFGVIFDMDDTVFHSNSHIVPTYREAIIQMTGQVPSTEFLDQYHGRTVPQYVAMINEEFRTSLDPVIFQAVLSEIEDAIHLNKKIRPYPGLEKLLIDFTSRGIPVSIGTSSGRARANRILTHLGMRKQMLAVVAEEDVNRHKPAPDTFIAAANRMGVLPERCIVFEDSFGGLRAAQAGGMIPVAMDLAYNTHKQLSVAHHVTSQYETVTVDLLLRLVQRHIA